MLGVLAATPELEAVAGSVTDALERVEDRFRRHLESELWPVQQLCAHLERYRGKMLRPALVVLSGLATRPDGDIGEPHVVSATVCEMVHMATLVHDDVLDEADIRRSGETVNRLHGNELAVILGDYLFSTAYHLCSGLDDQTTARLIGATGKLLCEGELLQLHHRENFSIDERTYHAIVERKTGSLVSAACRLGGLHAGADAELQDRLAGFGMGLGVAFQIRDDLLDITGSRETVGKPVQRDAQLGKLTLPLIHHLTTADAGTRHATLKVLAEINDAGPESDRPDLQGDLAARLDGTGSVRHAERAADALIDEAIGCLDELGDSPAKAALCAMAAAAVARKK